MLQLAEVTLPRRLGRNRHLQDSKKLLGKWAGEADKSYWVAWRNEFGFLFTSPVFDAAESSHRLQSFFSLVGVALDHTVVLQFIAHVGLVQYSRSAACSIEHVAWYRGSEPRCEIRSRMCMALRIGFWRDNPSWSSAGKAVVAWQSATVLLGKSTTVTCLQSASRASSVVYRLCSVLRWCESQSGPHNVWSSDSFVSVCDQSTQTVVQHFVYIHTIVQHFAYVHTVAESRRSEGVDVFKMCTHSGRVFASKWAEWERFLFKVVIFRLAEKHYLVFFVLFFCWLFVSNAWGCHLTF